MYFGFNLAPLCVNMVVSTATTRHGFILVVSYIHLHVTLDELNNFLCVKTPPNSEIHQPLWSSIVLLRFTFWSLHTMKKATWFAPWFVVPHYILIIQIGVCCPTNDIEWHMNWFSCSWCSIVSFLFPRCYGIYLWLIWSWYMKQTAVKSRDNKSYRNIFHNWPIKHINA